MKNKELIAILLDMDLEKEVRLTKACMAIEITKNGIKEKDSRIEISTY